MRSSEASAGSKAVRGFTLIEVLITTALTVMLMLALSYVYVGFSRTFPYVESSIAVTSGGSQIVDETREAALQATHILASHAFSGTTYTSGSTTAVFELPAITSAGATISGSYDYIGIYASGTDAYRLIDAAPASSRTSGSKKLTSVLDSLLFTYDNVDVTAATSLYVDATTTTSAHGQALGAHVRAHVYLRNL